MNIIERVAELLGPIEQSPIEQSNSKSSTSNELSPIERAVSEGEERSGRVEPREFVARPEPEAQDRKSEAGPRPESQRNGTPATFDTSRTPAIISTRKTPAMLRVDRDQLRRQHMVLPDGARTPVAECFRLIKSQLLMNVAKPREGAPPNLVMVTSARAGEGKTFCAINLAISIALERNHSVLLVDGDVVNPTVPRTLGLTAEQGLMDVLDRRIDMEQVLRKTDVGKLTLLLAGTAHQHATELLASDAMHVLIREMAERYEDRIIIFDSPPLLDASEAGVLASQMGQIVMVVEAGKTPEGVLLDALGRIDSSKVVGLVLNKGQGPRRGYSSYDGYS